MPRHSLITGATGFVGACVARRLLREGHEVHLLLRRGYRGWRIDDIRSQVHVHEVDPLDRAGVRALVKAVRPEWMFNLMAHGAYSSQQDPHEMVRTNLLGTMNLIEAGLEVGFEAFVHTGSSSEYGLKAFPPAETELLQPNSDYAITKAAATHLCQHRSLQYDAHIAVLRLYSVFGPFEEPTRLIPTLVVNGLRGRLPPLVDPRTARDFIYVDDVVDAMLAVAEATHLPRGSVFNVGTGTQVTLADAVAAIRRLLAVADQPKWGTMPARGWDTTTWVSDASLLRRSTNWGPRYAFEAGLAETVEWLRRHPALRSYYDSCVK